MAFGISSVCSFDKILPSGPVQVHSSPPFTERRILSPSQYSVSPIISASNSELPVTVVDIVPIHPVASVTVTDSIAVPSSVKEKVGLAVFSSLNVPVVIDHS